MTVLNKTIKKNIQYLCFKCYPPWRNTICIINKYRQSQFNGELIYVAVVYIYHAINDIMLMDRITVSKGRFVTRTTRCSVYTTGITFPSLNSKGKRFKPELRLFKQNTIICET